jgi:probable HAF family extracellular repeat protein
MTDLGSLGGVSEARGINDRGQVVGNYQITGEGFVLHAFLYANGTMTDMGTLGGSWSRAYGINCKGQVVGLAQNTANQDRAFLYNPPLNPAAVNMLLLNE